MKSPKLYRLLRVLDRPMLKQFRRFLNSPYHNTNTILVSLFDILKKHHPTFAKEKLKKEKLFKKLYPQKVFSDKRIRDLMSLLSLCLEDFLVHESLRADQQKKQWLLMQAFDRYHLQSFFEKKNQELIEQVDRQKQKDLHYHYRKFDLYQQFFFNRNTDKFKKDIDHIQMAMQELDLFYTLGKLQLSAELKARERILAEQHEIVLLDAIQQSLQQKQFPSASPLFDIYQALIQLHQSESAPSIFVQVYHQLVDHLSIISKDDQRSILQHLLNYAIRHSNQGDLRMNEKIWQLYDLEQRQDLLLINNQITEYTFGNIVSISCQLKKFDWLESFVDNYQIYLDASIRKSTLLWARITQSFFQEAYENVLVLIQEVPNKRNHGYRVRHLLLRTYYELFQQAPTKYENPLLSQIKSYQQYLRRQDQIGTERILAQKNFVSFIKKLVPLKHLVRVSTKQRQQLLQKLKATKSIAFRHWLEQKVKAL
ncbi:MAG: hypothetical protein AAF985_19345 [Bacteroidota bacterium]